MSCCSRNDNAQARLRLAEDISNQCTTVFCSECKKTDSLDLRQGCENTYDCDPIPVNLIQAREYRLCTDQNGCMAQYPTDCRSRFWPTFSHPRWLPCGCLYCTGQCNNQAKKY